MSKLNFFWKKNTLLLNMGSWANFFQSFRVEPADSFAKTKFHLFRGRFCGETKLLNYLLFEKENIFWSWSGQFSAGLSTMHFTYHGQNLKKQMLSENLCFPISFRIWAVFLQAIGWDFLGKSSKNACYVSRETFYRKSSFSYVVYFKIDSPFCAQKF